MNGRDASGRGGSSLVVAALLAVLAAACSPPWVDTTAGLDDAAVSELRTTVEDSAAGTTGGTVVRIDTPAGGLTLAAGEADVSRGRELTGEEAFRVGSVTKLLTATVALQLVEEDELRLDTPVAEVIPEAAGRFEHGDRITLRQLLAHRSGLADIFTNPRLVPAMREAARTDAGVATTACAETAQLDLLDYAAGQPPRFEPGGRAGYSNTNYLLVGRMIEATTGSSLAEAYRQRILEPLGMAHTWLTCAEHPRAEIAHGYERTDSRGSTFTATNAAVMDVTGFGRYGWAAGGLVSTPGDLTVFARALFTGGLFDEPATLTEMRQPHGLALGPGAAPYGLGVVLEQHAIGHDGTIAGYNARLRYYPARDTVVVALGNQTGLGNRTHGTAAAAESAARAVLLNQRATPDRTPGSREQQR